MAMFKFHRLGFRSHIYTHHLTLARGILMSRHRSNPAKRLVRFLALGWEILQAHANNGCHLDEYADQLPQFEIWKLT